MDEKHTPAEAGSLPLQGPHWHRGPEPGKAAFPPLRLVVRANGFAVDLTQPNMIVGRHTDADIRLPLPDVSRRHCRLLFTDGSWQVLDLHSLNGIFVNGRRVERAVLHSGDVVGIGSFTFEVELGRAAEAGPGEAPRSTEEILQSIADVLPEPPRDQGQSQRRAS